MSGVFCNQCGHRNPTGSNFCSSCGSVLEVGEERRTLSNYIRGFKNLLYLKALFYFGVLGIMAHRDLLQWIEQVPVMLSQGANSIGENNFTESISCEPRSLSAQNTARIESVNWPQKKNLLDEKKSGGKWHDGRSNRYASRESPESIGDSRPYFRARVSLLKAR